MAFARYSSFVLWISCPCENIPGNSGRPISAAVENIRISPSQDDFATHISETNDQVTNIINDLSEILENNYAAKKSFIEKHEEALNEHQKLVASEDPDFDHDGEPIIQSFINDRIDLYWPMDDQFYTGTVEYIYYNAQHVDGD